MSGKQLCAVLGFGLLMGMIGGTAGWFLGQGTGPNENAVIQLMTEHGEFSRACRAQGATVNVAITSIEFDAEAENASPVTDDTLRKLLSQPLSSTASVRRVAIKGADLTDAGLELLTKFDYLESLDLTNCRKITDAGLEHLKHIPALETLVVSGCEGLTPAGVDQLRNYFEASFKKKNLRVTRRG